jgi:hypothetical protein
MGRSASIFGQAIIVAVMTAVAVMPRAIADDISAATQPKVRNRKPGRPKGPPK